VGKRGHIVLKYLCFAAAILVAAAASTSSAQADDYGDEWYRADFWSGEYPGGFTMTKETHFLVRPALSLKAERSIDCVLPAKATYQPWNNKRVLDDGLAFVSFSKIDKMKIKKDIAVTLYTEPEGTETPLKLKKGANWRYLVYLAEGQFRMEYDGVVYQGDQDLLDASTSTLPEAERGYDEWLRVNCANNVWGWIYVPDTKDDNAFAEPNIKGYGEATDAE
jgi:hypothetical protein